MKKRPETHGLFLSSAVYCPGEADRFLPFGLFLPAQIRAVFFTLRAF